MRQRSFRSRIVGFVAGFAALALGAVETPSTVVTLVEDVVDPEDGEISLREAIDYAGTGDCGTTITFKLKADEWGDILAYVTPTGTFTIAKSITIESKELQTSNTIEYDCEFPGTLFEIAEGASVVLDGGQFRAYGEDEPPAVVYNAGVLTLKNITFCYSSNVMCVENDGALRMELCSMSQNYGGIEGGTLYNRGSAVLANCTISGCEAMVSHIHNLGTLRMEQCLVSGNAYGDYGDEDTSNPEFGAIWNAGTAILNGVGFSSFSARADAGSAITSASNAVLQVNNSSFYLVYKPAIVCSTDGETLVMNSSFSANSKLQYVDDPDSDPSNWGVDDSEWASRSTRPLIELAGTPKDLRVYNCAFDWLSADVFAETVPEVRGCAFTTASFTNLFFTARKRRLGENCAYSLVPVTNLTAHACGVPLRRFEGALGYLADGTWHATGAQLPYLTDEAFTVDMFGDARSLVEGNTCFPGATVDPNSVESMSSRPTTPYDIVDPYDGLISLREAFAYAPYVSAMDGYGGGSAYLDIQMPDLGEPYVVTNGPIVITKGAEQMSIAGYGVWLSGGGVSGILEVPIDTSIEFYQVNFRDASGTGNGGAVSFTGKGRFNFYECNFTNCATAGSGGAVYVGERGTLNIDCSKTTFIGCSAGENGGAIFTEAGEAVVSRAYFKNCTARGRGGAAYLQNITQENCTYINCSASEGGGLWAEPGSYSQLYFANCHATDRGGALAGTLGGVDAAMFVGNTASEGSACYLSGANRKLFRNLSFTGNKGGAVVMASDGGTLRLANCDEWSNEVSADGNFAVGVMGTEVSVFNSVLPDQADNGTLITDGVTRLAFAQNLGSVLACEADGSPCVLSFYYNEWSTGEAYNDYAEHRFTCLVVTNGIASAGVGMFTAEDGEADLATYDRTAGVWRTAAGAEVTAEVASVGNDLRGKGRGDCADDDASTYGLGALTHISGERSDYTVTTLADVTDGADMRTSLHEAVASALDRSTWYGFWWSRSELCITFELDNTTCRTLVLEEPITFTQDYAFAESGQSLVFDGACKDGTHVTIDLNGASLFFQEDAGLKNNFVFRNLMFRNGVIPGSANNAGIIECLGSEGSLRFENCAFENCRAEGNWPGVVYSDKELSFANCRFTGCAGGSGAVVSCEGSVTMTDCVVAGTTLKGGNVLSEGDGVIHAGGLVARNLSISGTIVDEGTSSLLTLVGEQTNRLVNIAFSETTWLGASTGQVVFCSHGVTDLGNLTSGKHGGCAFLRTANGAQVRILNGVVEGDCAGAVRQGAFCSTVGDVVAQPGDSEGHRVCAPPADSANPGSAVGVYVWDGVLRLAVCADGTWLGADGLVLPADAVSVETTDIFGVSRQRGGNDFPYYTCGALSEYMPDLVVTTTEDVVDANDGQVSFREAVIALLGGQRRLNGDRLVSFSIAGTRNPQIVWAQPFVVTNAQAFSAEHPLKVNGTNGRGQVTFDGEGERSLFTVGGGACLELANCSLVRGAALYGGAVRADGGMLGLSRVTVADSSASALGGGIYGGDIWASDCTFTNCVSGNGGGAVALAAYGSLQAENCAFVDNEATSGGGAVYGRAGVEIDIERTTFYGNRADAGAAVAVGDGGLAWIANSVLCANEVESVYGGVVYGESSSVTLSEVTSWGNGIAETDADATLLESWGGSPAIFKSLVGEAQSVYTDVAVDSVSLFGLNGATTYQQVSNGAPVVAWAKVSGVRHAYRRPTKAAIYAGTGSQGLDLFGNARVNYTLGAVDYGSEPTEEDDDDEQAEITNPDFLTGVDLDQVEVWMEAMGVEVEEVNASSLALASFLLNTPILSEDPQLVITAIEEDVDEGVWRVTVHAEATYGGSVHAVALGEQNGATAQPLINGKLTVSKANALKGPWTDQAYDVANLTFTNSGDAVITARAGQFFRAVITK